jgi:prepilin-type N-terminal cleavage/methylation domain-containing protein
MKRTIRAFTLIELMVVTVIIVLLASLSSTAYFGAMQSAREVKTVGTIAKLDAAIADIYESYEFIFEHIEDSLDSASQTAFNTNKATMSESDITKLKRLLMYDLLRMEMPSNRAETDPANPPITINGTDYLLEPSVVQQIYYKFTQDHPSSATLATQSAELLYLIIANLDPEAFENFTATEVGDTDGNGLSEFIDGWGRPIAFLRFAPGFTDTDRQPDLSRTEASSLDLNSPSLNIIPALTAIPSGTTNVKDKIINQWQDPFDPDMLNGESWFLYPVIVSAGRDGLFGINISIATLLNPFAAGALIGAPIGSEHHDNIHNHANFR